MGGLQIDVYRELSDAEAMDDVSLDEFADELEEWIIDEFQKIGLDTAKSVLAVTKEDLVRRTDLEEETIEAVLGVLKQEFEED